MVNIFEWGMNRGGDGPREVKVVGPWFCNVKE